VSVCVSVCVTGYMQVEWGSEGRCVTVCVCVCVYIRMNERRCMCMRVWIISIERTNLFVSSFHFLLFCQDQFEIHLKPIEREKTDRKREKRNHRVTKRELRNQKQNNQVSTAASITQFHILQWNWLGKISRTIHHGTR
jgi:hypothetical protein